jgi:hypothetical protein
MGKLTWRGAFILATVSLFALTLVAVPGAQAYNNAVQWQAGFSGTFVSVAGGSVNGFWGWCVFGGSSGSSAVGTTGTTGDCQITNYFGLGFGAPVNTFSVAISITGWILEPTSAFAIPGVGPYFFLTSGSGVLSGPGASFIYSLLGLPVGSAIPLSSSTGPSACGPAPTLAFGSPCDSGIPAMPGHFGFTLPALTIQIQVTKVS